VATTVPAFEPHQPAAPIGNAVSDSGGFVAGFGEGEPLVAEVGDYLQAPAECLNVGGECAQFGSAGLDMLDG
jgi:hypothetical protein